MWLSKSKECHLFFCFFCHHDTLVPGSAHGRDAAVVARACLCSSGSLLVRIGLLCKLARVAALRGSSPVSTWLSGWRIGWVLVLITLLSGHLFAVLNLSNCTCGPCFRAFLLGVHNQRVTAQQMIQRIIRCVGARILGSFHLNPLMASRMVNKLFTWPRKPGTSTPRPPLPPPAALDFVQSVLSSFLKLFHPLPPPTSLLFLLFSFQSLLNPNPQAAHGASQLRVRPLPS